MAVRNLTQFTATAQKGLKEFLQAEDGGTGKRTALSMGLLVGGAVMMQHLAAQTAEAAPFCKHYQFCPDSEVCFGSNTAPHDEKCHGDCSLKVFCDDG